MGKEGYEEHNRPAVCQKDSMSDWEWELSLAGIWRNNQILFAQPFLGQMQMSLPPPTTALPGYLVYTRAELLIYLRNSVSVFALSLCPLLLQFVPPKDARTEVRRWRSLVMSSKSLRGTDLFDPLRSPARLHIFIISHRSFHGRGVDILIQ